MARKGNPISVRLYLNRSSDSSWVGDSYELEIIWTIFPSILLLVIPSVALLDPMGEVDKESITFDSYMIPEDEPELGKLRLLEVDNRVVVPAETHIRIIVTSTDVLHSWAVPSLGVKCDDLASSGVKCDAVPGPRTSLFFPMLFSLLTIAAMGGGLAFAAGPGEDNDFASWGRDLSLGLPTQTPAPGNAPPAAELPGQEAAAPQEPDLRPGEEQGLSKAERSRLRGEMRKILKWTPRPTVWVTGYVHDPKDINETDHSYRRRSLFQGFKHRQKG